MDVVSNHDRHSTQCYTPVVLVAPPTHTVLYCTLKKARRTKRRDIHHGDKITNQVTGRSILPRMLVSITNISILEERNKSSRNRPRTTHPLSALSSTAVSLVPATTTDDLFHVPSTISRAMTTLRQLPKTPSTSCDLAVLVDNNREASRNHPIPPSHPHFVRHHRHGHHRGSIA
jgi:hypothetical protein